MATEQAEIRKNDFVNHYWNATAIKRVGIELTNGEWERYTVWCGENATRPRLDLADHIRECIDRDSADRPIDYNTPQPKTKFIPITLTDVEWEDYIEYCATHDILISEGLSQCVQMFVRESMRECHE